MKAMVGKVEDGKLYPKAEIALKREFIRKFGNIFNEQKGKEDRKPEQEKKNESSL